MWVLCQAPPSATIFEERKSVFMDPETWVENKGVLRDLLPSGSTVPLLLMNVSDRRQVLFFPCPLPGLGGEGNQAE